MNQKLLTKVLATILAVILTFTNFVMLGVYASKTYATDTLENQDTGLKDGNIEFDAYFMQENKNKTHEISLDIDNQETNIYLGITVKKGYLKNAKITIQGEDNEASNYKIKNIQELPDTIESISEEKNEIALKQINGGTRSNFRNTNYKYKR